MVTGMVACHIPGLVVLEGQVAPENREFQAALMNPVDQETPESRAVLLCLPCPPCLPYQTAPAGLSDPAPHAYPEAHEELSYPVRQ